ncbi:OmpA/MotB domain protein [Candidatus Propionivibrio aalborgensis]|jgi:outer membrane protein OmpA-like peptidoglycan-associated protein/ABC-type nitrate/sulfonate/bicarbonate transport system substrate-binding protein|uniref:OmpA/MotB domain protein n=1 Tax=Candidatus Propionivibrio aalborgensis TaxID=1860101 RepID=A0A1A8Y0U4_9RHOO|nr:phosphate ABC transporter substrate-binding/OmpA family protein [Candidatus Propionivibrio aalborgensis]MBK7563505.1 OmpA family protein [Propionivibrio sp.]MBK9028640.1 OmpA family protein [Propionivibrio sp.]MBP6422227.1 OmpA family protein [Propionivibrio sp.]SBT10576.1 OmpA/MotB domain protein [Candidatus Propionivibrio aalborgensis]HRC60404.1 phosphate ABC transporter substrate-binding/OmpA family protein [Candidatus Propionivibrio aalborgensis]
MAQLTPMAKGLITVIVLGIAGSAAWNFGLKELWQNRGGETSTMEKSAAKAPSANDPAASSAKAAATATKLDGSAALGSAANPLRVSIVSFHGYAPALVANGNSLTTQQNSIYSAKGVNVQFVIQDDIPTLSTIFESGAAQCAWRTSDFWAQEQPNLRNAGLDGRAVMIVDNTRGGDAVIARNPAIASIEDLAGRSVALLQFTPSHGMLIDAIENSSLSARKKDSIRMVFINAEEGTAGVRAAFESANVEAAVLWDPDLALAQRAVKGSRIVYSTKTATNLIFDVMVCDSRLLAKPEGQAVIQKFVEGWMEGVQAARSNPDNAVDALVNTEEFFKLLADKEGKPFIKSLFSNLVWTGVEDNARILGLAGGTNHYERVYRRFDEIYRKAGALANPKSPVITPQDSFDYRFIKSMLARDKSASEAAAKPQETFSQAALKDATQNAAIVTKPVMVGFSTGTAELTKRAQKTIDEEMVPFIENNGKAYFEVSGNSDSTGSREVNLRISGARAKAVVDYLNVQWEFPRDRFKIVGNGPDRPLCNESNPAGEGLSLEECRAMNRTTRIGVFGGR